MDDEGPWNVQRRIFWNVHISTGWWFHPLWTILVNWDDYSQYMGKYKNIPNHQPVNLFWIALWVLWPSRCRFYMLNCEWVGLSRTFSKEQHDLLKSPIETSSYQLKTSLKSPLTCDGKGFSWNSFQDGLQRASLLEVEMDSEKWYFGGLNEEAWAGQPTLDLCAHIRIYIYISVFNCTVNTEHSKSFDRKQDR